jgi:hypothetical protein
LERRKIVEASLVILDVGCLLFNEKQRILDEAAFPVKPV